MMTLTKASKIRTFELIKETGDLAWRAGAYFNTGEPVADSPDDFFKRYLYPLLGKPLRPKQTRGIRCTRVFYDKDDMPFFMKVYDTYGACEESILLMHMLQIDLNRNSDEVITYTITLVDVRGIIQAQPAGSTGLTFQEDHDLITVEKIPRHPMDIGAKDPWPRINPFHWTRAAFYDLGYKVVHHRSLDVDGLVRLGRHIDYDAEGRTIRELFYESTPWGGMSTAETRFWFYHPEERLVTSRYLRADSSLMQLDWYELDQEGRILLHRMAFAADPDEPFHFIDESSGQRMQKCVTHHYHYNERGQLGKLVTEFADGRTPSVEQCDYDAQGRLVRVVDFKRDPFPAMVTEYTYPAPLKAVARQSGGSPADFLGDDYPS